MLELMATISSIIDLLSYVENLGSEVMYRGQSNVDWPLLPSLVRYSHHIQAGYDCIGDIEAHLIEKFIQFSIPHNDIRSKPLIEQLVHCQHYGLPTRLLDWSSNPLKALFFAVTDSVQEDKDGVVHVFEPNGWFEGTKNLSEIKSLSPFFPELLNERIASQDACFIAFPLPGVAFSVQPLTTENYPEDTNLLFSLVIPANRKMQFRRELATLGVTHRTIYPGLDGVAKWVKSELSCHEL